MTENGGNVPGKKRMYMGYTGGETDPAPPAERRLIVAARHDRMAYPEPAVALHDRWGGPLHWHDGGHAGHIFSRRVQAETERFLTEVAGS